MKIGGILKFSTLDYPGKLSAVVFAQGCPLRCVYCHNPDFLDATKSGNFEFSEFLKFLETRIGLLDAVVFSGGDPIIQSDLYESIEKVKKLGFLVGVHTSGIIPDVFEKIIEIVDWVGFDIKTFFDDYEKITQIPNSGEFAKLSLEKLINSQVDFEVRTTVDSRNISSEDLLKIAKLLKEKGVKKWVLQECILRNKKGTDLKIPFPEIDIIHHISNFIEIEIRMQ